MTEFDNTHLSIDIVEDTKLIHRDYIAHCMRWSYVLKWLTIGGRYKTASVFDIGAGKDLPLFKMICSNRLTKTKYAGVDINKLELPKNFSKRSVECKLYSETDFMSLSNEVFEGVNVFTSFEVLEHVPPEYAREVVERVFSLMNNDAHFFVSTPCYDEQVGPADNHINEMTRDAFGYLLESTGFEIVENFGTFASQKDYKKKLTPGELEVYNGLSKYYHHHYLATIMAPIYPQYSRNNIWLVKKADSMSNRRFPTKPEGQWSQHDNWRSLLK